MEGGFDSEEVTENFALIFRTPQTDLNHFGTLRVWTLLCFSRHGRPTFSIDLVLVAPS